MISKYAEELLFWKSMLRLLIKTKQIILIFRFGFLCKDHLSIPVFRDQGSPLPDPLNTNTISF